jgi:hypothetical protein
VTLVPIRKRSRAVTTGRHSWIDVEPRKLFKCQKCGVFHGWGPTATRYETPSRRLIVAPHFVPPWRAPPCDLASELIESMVDGRSDAARYVNDLFSASASAKDHAANPKHRKKRETPEDAELGWFTSLVDLYARAAPRHTTVDDQLKWRAEEKERIRRDRQRKRQSQEACARRKLRIVR